mmetsp:Transcript_22294/g.87872  ORF Transcript_22294/g.87872 Transcript_22294/m.87872 type:complete len:322 (-) Transcript_22294:1717-2682(-)
MAALVDPPMRRRQGQRREASGPQHEAGCPQLLVPGQPGRPGPTGQRRQHAHAEQPHAAATPEQTAAQQAEQGRRESPQRGQQAFGVEGDAAGRVPFVGEAAQQRGVQALVQAAQLVQRRTDMQQRTVAQQQRQQQKQPAPPAQLDDGPARDDKADADALQHAHDAELGFVHQPPGQRMQHQAQADDAQPALEHRGTQRARRRTGVDTRPQGECCRHPDDEQEEREDQVGRRAAMPVRVFQRPIDMAPVARVVDEQHGRHRQPAQRVDRRDALRRQPAAHGSIVPIAPRISPLSWLSSQANTPASPCFFANATLARTARGSS